MFCSNCHYTASDDLPTCPKCGFNWSKMQKILGLNKRKNTTIGSKIAATPVNRLGRQRTQQTDLVEQKMPNDALQPNTEAQISQPIHLHIEPTFSQNEEKSKNQKTDPPLSTESVLAKYLSQKEL